MKKIAFAFFPFIAAGFILSETKPPEPAHHSVEGRSTQIDGPYVLYRGEQVYINYIQDQQGTKTIQRDSVTASKKSDYPLTVLTDVPGTTFTVHLKEDLQTEKTEFTKVSKLFILSDIEGNFRAFRRLLQANQVIDSAFNWTFGNGHLVLTGDFVDRGNQQTEVLWLIYSLEEKAKAAGGYVHYILGNHEIMNMSGDLRYLNPKYTEHAGLLKENYVTLFGENSELGRWLRTKNVIEKVGDLLFCHGGISAAVNRMDIGTTKINKLVRPFFADSTSSYPDPQTDTLYSDLGPFWYRGYYYGPVKASASQVDSTLAAYKVKHIVTGHTIVADTISVLYGGKVFNTDLHHANGHSEALLVENGHHYRVNSVGEKFLVWQ